MTHDASGEPSRTGRDGTGRVASALPSLREVRIEGFRSIKAASFRPGPLSALVGAASAGKSNVLAAIRAVLDPASAPITAADVSTDGDEAFGIVAELSDGSSRSLTGEPPNGNVAEGPRGPTPIFLPFDLRTGPVVAPSTNRTPAVERASEILQPAGPDDRTGASEAARGLVAGLESWLDTGLSGMILMIEEPELFLPPQSQRYLYRLLENMAAAGNQVIYTTHSPSFLNVTRLDELVLIERSPDAGTRVLQPEPLPADEEFRAASEFDAARSEIFLAKAAILVEGLTEKLALPFVFHALGYDPDRERISIIECGGKPNIPLVARIARVVDVPFIVLHDRDAPAGKKPIQAERRLNRLIGEIAGRDRRVEMVPDFEGIAGLRGRRHKPARAWHAFATLKRNQLPAPLTDVVERAVAMARADRPRPG